MDSKTFQFAYTFDDLVLIPAKSAVLPNQVDVRSRLSRNIRLNIPIVSAAMDTVTESATAITLAREGGIGVIHKNMGIDQQALEVERVKKSESGMIRQILVAGEGAQPEPTDEVKVHYHGTLRDGTVFDSSVDRGEPAQFPLNRVIPCWTEAVTQMKVGGKSRIVCPAAIAYGSRGMGEIPGDAALVFEVELLEIIE